MRREEKTLCCEGSITVLFALSLTLIVAIVCTSLEAARREALSYYTAQAQESALESVFAGYYRPLWERYHLFFMAEGPGLVSDMEEALSYYGGTASEENPTGNRIFRFEAGEPEIVCMTTAADQGGEAFLDQICEDMESHGKKKWVMALTEGTDQLEEADKAADYLEKLSGYGEQLEEAEEQYRIMEEQGKRLKEAYESLEGSILAQELPSETIEALIGEVKENISGIRDQTESAYEGFVERAGALRTLLEEKGEESGEIGKYEQEVIKDFEAYTKDDGDRRRQADEWRSLLEQKTKALQAALDAEGQEEDWRERLTETVSEGKRTIQSVLPEEIRQGKTESPLLDGLKNWKTQKILDAVLENSQSVSEKKLKETGKPSEENYEINTVEGETPGRPVLPERQALAAFYMTEHFGYYGKEKEDTALSYEAEYIIGKSESDRENLAKAAEKVLGLRTGINVIYLLGDREKNLEAEGMAASLVGFTGLVPLIHLTAKLILGAWALAEAVNDTARLFSGDEVALLKTYEDWKISLPEAAGILAGTAAEGKRGGGLHGEGGKGIQWNYERYLQILFLIGSLDGKLFRMMDLMEANVHRKDSRFFMENCVSYAEVETRFRSGRYEFYKTAAYGY